MTTWMIVEDEPDVYEMLLAMSEIMGNDGIAFVDGDEAIAWIEDVDNGQFHGELPDLALIDILLPSGISGAMVSERLRKSAILGQVPIVLMTGFQLSDAEEGEVVAKAGADLLIRKPLPALAELQRTLERVIARRANPHP